MPDDAITEAELVEIIGKAVDRDGSSWSASCRLRVPLADVICAYAGGDVSSELARALGYEPLPRMYRRVRPMPTRRERVPTLASCCNGDGRPIQPPSKVLCAECLAKLDAQFQSLKRALAPKEKT